MVEGKQYTLIWKTRKTKNKTATTTATTKQTNKSNKNSCDPMNNK